MDIDVGTEIGQYVLEARLGGGGFGSVWRARSRQDGRVVAIKLFTGALSSGDNATLRAEVELLAATASSRSPHVVRVLSGGVQPLPYIVMEYIDGTDLGAQLRERGTLPPREVIRVALGVTDALRALSEAGIIHRDVKPANVMIDRDGTVKLTDFGIAKIIGFDTITIAGQLPMTMAYAAPEAWEGAPTHLTDLYAVGILLYQCLCGAPPFSGNYGALYRHHTTTPPNLDALPTETPASLRELIQVCLEKDPRQRIQSAQECTSLLEQAATELAVKEPAAIEPSRFGPWLRGEPHPALLWAWHCTHETTGAAAIVEVHWFDNLQEGDALRAAVAASPRLAALGAGRVFGTNRLVLRPGEAWAGTPDGAFSFWVAREDDPSIDPPTVVGVAELRAIVSQLLALHDTAAESGMVLAMSRDEIRVGSGATVSLRRAGLVAATGDPLQQAMLAIEGLPLTDEAREIAVAAPDLRRANELLVPAKPEPVSEPPLGVASTPVFLHESTPTDDGTEHVARPERFTREVASAQPPPPSPRPDGPALMPVQTGSGGGGRRGRFLLIVGGLFAIFGVGMFTALGPGSSCFGGSTPSPTATAGATSSATTSPRTATPIVGTPTLPPPIELTGPAPELVSIDIPAQGRVGDTVTITVRAQNHGVEAARRGGISVSIPGIPSDAVSIPPDASAVHLLPPNTAVSMIADLCRPSTGDSTDTLIELNSEDWQSNAVRVLVFSLRLQRPGEVRLLIRTTLQTLGTGCLVTRPSADQSPTLDQQHLPVLSRSIEVLQ